MSTRRNVKNMLMLSGVSFGLIFVLPAVAPLFDSVNFVFSSVLLLGASVFFCLMALMVIIHSSKVATGFFWGGFTAIIMLVNGISTIADPALVIVLNFVYGASIFVLVVSSLPRRSKRKSAKDYDIDLSRAGVSSILDDESVVNTGYASRYTSAGSLLFHDDETRSSL